MVLAANRLAPEIEMPLQTLVSADHLAKLANNPFPGESDAYREARRALLKEEIEFRRHLTEVAEKRRGLPPGPVIEKNYRFHDANGEEVGLIDLFGHKDTLVTYFWMYGPQRERPCPMCTNWLGAVNGNANDIAQRVSLKILGRSPVERQIAFARAFPSGNQLLMRRFPLVFPRHAFILDGAHRVGFQHCFFDRAFSVVNAISILPASSE